MLMNVVVFARGLALSCLVCACTSLASGGDVIRMPDAGSNEEQDAGPCPTGGASGTLAVFVEAPDGVSPTVSVGAQSDFRELAGSQILTLPAGEYVVTARRVTVAGDMIAKAYAATEPRQRACIRARERTEVSIQYEMEPGAMKLWSTGTSGTYHTASYAAAALARSAPITPENTISEAVGTPTSVAFDPEGNLWISDLSGKVLGYLQNTLGVDRASGTPDILLEGKVLCPGAFPCGPEGLAFDERGNLWLALPDSVVRIDKRELAGRNEPEIKVTLKGESIDRPCALAFSKNGDLWVLNAGNSSVVRFAAGRLSRDDDAPADNTIFGQARGPVFSALSNPKALAFDGEGSLWVGYVAQGVLARYTADDQTKDGPVAPEVQLDVNGSALLTGLAFDEAGHLWTTGPKAVVRIDRAALRGAKDPKATLLRLEVQGAVEDLAFDPPALSTPLAR